MQSSDIVNAARSYLGVKFRHQGRTRAGIDCVGLLVCVARDLGASDYDATGYNRRAQGLGFLHHFQNNLDQISTQDAKPGDVLVFVESIFPCHTGIMSARHDLPHLIHAHAPRGVVLEEPFGDEWRSKLRYAFRFPDLTEA